MRKYPLISTRNIPSHCKNLKRKHVRFFGCKVSKIKRKVYSPQPPILTAVSYCLFDFLAIFVDLFLLYQFIVMYFSLFLFFYFFFIFFTNPSAQAGFEFRVFLLLDKLPHQGRITPLSYLPIARGRIIGFIPFPRVFVLREMQSVSSRI